MWAFGLGGNTNDFGLGIAAFASDIAYVTARLTETPDFDPGPGTANLTSAGNDDVFVAKYSETITDIFESGNNFNVMVYLNPSSGKISVELKKKKDTTYQLADMSRRIIESGILTTSKIVMDLSKYENGFYFLKMGE